MSISNGNAMSSNAGSKAKAKAASVVARLREAGFTAYFVGGCVRDLVMGLPPKDYDIATDARPEDVRRLFRRTLGVGAQFGVIIVLLGREHIEVATFRSDGEYHDGRRPDSVTFAGEVEDVKRRDFTINGLLYDPETGRVIDHVGGREDIRRGVLRCIGDPEKRFDEDKLRMLRVVRFAARFGYQIEPDTLRAARRRAPEILRVSAERIREELVHIITGPAPRRGMELLDNIGLGAAILPELADMHGCPAGHRPDVDVWEHTMRLLDNLGNNPPPAVALGALLHDVGKPKTMTPGPDRPRFHGHQEVGARMTRAILSRLRFPNSVIDETAYIVARHMDFLNVRDMRESRLRRFLMDPRFERLLEVHRLDLLAADRSPETHEFCVAKQAELRREKREQHPRSQPPLLDGRALIRAGFTPGPAFREILDFVYDAQLEGEVASPDEALALAIREFGARRGKD